MYFEDFTDFEQKILNITHTDHHLTDNLFASVKHQFESHMSSNGAHFQVPVRIDLLHKAHATPA
ncbi:MAG: hypothetical protein Q9M17_08145 [Mariprofundus sp.]|nr:hypothetical protein [Mariprofundus sp.]